MRSKVLVPVVLLSLGVFSTTTFFGCSSDSPKGSGTGGKGGATATGGKSGTGGSASGGSGTGGDATGGSGTGGDATGGAGGTAATGGAGGTSVTGGAGGGTAGAAGSNVGGAAGNAATGGVGGNGMTGGRGGIAGGGGAAGSAVGGAGGGATWPKTLAACMTVPAASPADFCAYYDTTCGSMYSPATGHFASAADCMTRYMTYMATQKTCASYHVCAAGTPNGANAHCLHPAGGGGNPCMLP
ncbi:MAG: hypothetical protein ABJA82_11860 [Myxococcales bacterium]